MLLSPIRTRLLMVLKVGLSSVHVPYAYGFAIILLTVLVKAATFPLSKKQVESAMSMRSLQPQIKAIQQRYAGDQRIQLETARLYKLAGINRLQVLMFRRCLPTLATIPVWIGLYRALSNVANEDGHPPLGWSDTVAYLVLPVILVVSQYISVEIMQSSQSDDPNVKNSQAITKFLPLMIGYFSLSVPSGLSLYWLTNNILSTAQQVWLQKLGGAKNPMMKPSDEILKEDHLQIQKPARRKAYTRRLVRIKKKIVHKLIRSKSHQSDAFLPQSPETNYPIQGISPFGLETCIDPHYLVLDFYQIE
ncbi:ALBINO3 protein [Salix suchowensis]|nr:ALBINO3 protein [Salix suchowensis]